jgi:hypothetical protein
MPHHKIEALSGLHGVRHTRGHPMEHNPHHTAHGMPLTEPEFREFLREEQKEGMHPSLRGKRF